MVSKNHWEKMTERELNYNNLLDVLKENTDKITNGDMSDVEATLYSQASSLNIMFAHLNTLAVNNLLASGKFEFGRQLMAMTLKAQNQSRMTLETLGNIKSGPMVCESAKDFATSSSCKNLHNDRCIAPVILPLPDNFCLNPPLRGCSYS